MDIQDIAYIGDDLPDVPVLQKVGLLPQQMQLMRLSKYSIHLKIREEKAVREFVDYIIRVLTVVENVCLEHLLASILQD